jgi:hypothetical protein
MGGYLLLRSDAGICDSLFMLEMLTPYAQKYNRTIIWDLMLYTASEVGSLFDFSKYPVPLICESNWISKIKYTDTEPKCFKKDILVSPKQTGPNLFFIDKQLAQFDMTKTYNDSVLLVYYGGRGGWVTMNNIHFSKKLIDNYHSKISQLPKTFDAVHLRATDHHNQKTEDDLAAVRKFVENKQNVYLATDNMKYMESLSEEFSQIIKSFTYEKIEEEYKSLHHNFGKTDPDCLEKALIDILICATSAEFLPSVGGFIRLIRHLHTNKELLQQLTSSVVDEIQEPKEELTSTVVGEPDKLQITSPSAQGRRKPIGKFFWLLQK